MQYPKDLFQFCMPLIGTSIIIRSSASVTYIENYKRTFFSRQMTFKTFMKYDSITSPGRCGITLEITSQYFLKFYKNFETNSINTYVYSVFRMLRSIERTKIPRIKY